MKELHRAQLACRALDVAIHQYQHKHLPVYKLAGECERALEDIVHLLNAIVTTHRLPKRLLKQQGINTDLITNFEEMVENVLRTSKKKSSID